MFYMNLKLVLFRVVWRTCTCLAERSQVENLAVIWKQHTVFASVSLVPVLILGTLWEM